MSDLAQHRLRKHGDFQRVYKSTRKQWASELAYFAASRVPDSEAAQRSSTTGPRIGLTVPKAMVRRAVDRNRIKRRLRALVGAALPLLEGLPLDVVLHPKRGVLQADFAALERELASVFRTLRAKHKGPAQPGRRRDEEPFRNKARKLATPAQNPPSQAVR